MAQMDIDAKLEKSLAELIKTSQKPQKRGTTVKSTQKAARASEKPSAARTASAQTGKSGRRKRGGQGCNALGAKAVGLKIRAPKVIASAGGGQRSTQAAASANLAAGRKARRNRGKDKQTGQLAGGPAPLKQHRQQQQQQRQQRQPPRQLQRGNAASAPAAPAKGIVVTLQNEYYRPAPADGLAPMLPPRGRWEQSARSGIYIPGGSW